MYTTDQNRTLQEKTKQWLEHTHNPEYILKHIEDLRDILRFHEYRYYIMNDPLISDGEYDRLFKVLEKTETENNTITSTYSLYS